MKQMLLFGYKANYMAFYQVKAKSTVPLLGGHQ
jgi:hypothetical protein